MYYHSAYDLNICSEIPLPELLQAEGDADVIIRLGQVEPLEFPNATWNGISFWRAANDFKILYERVGAILVKDGSEIIIDPAPDVDGALLRLMVMGPAFNILLQQRGLSLFHACVIAFSSKAIAFIAKKGRGKSTLGAVLHARGHELVADDLMALDDSGGKLMVIPSLPYFKLWPDSIKVIGKDPLSLPTLHPESDKRNHRANRGYRSKPIQLHGVVLLEFSHDLQISALRPVEALLKVLPHWYGALFGTKLLATLGLKAHFRDCANLVARVPIYVLNRPRSLTLLTDAAQLVDTHFACDL